MSNISKELAASLAATYVMYADLGDNTRALQAEHDAVIRYALVSAAAWKRLVAKEQRQAAADRAAIERQLAM